MKNSKINPENFKKDLNKVLELKPSSFRWKIQDKKQDIGLIAQDVEKVVPEIVVENKAIGDTEIFLKDLDGSDKFKTIDYSKLNVLLIDAINEQQEQIEDLKQEIEDIKNGMSS